MIIIKKKILVIFFISLILSFLIYKYSHKEKNQIFLITDSMSKLNINGNIKEFRYDNITYKELIEKIKSNDYKIVKGKEEYLNQYISSSNEIIININNHEYFNKCKKNDRIINNYDNILSLNINDLYSIIKRISNAKITIIGNYCKNKKHISNIKIPYKSIEFYSKTIK